MYRSTTFLVMLTLSSATAIEGGCKLGECDATSLLSVKQQLHKQDPTSLSSSASHAEALEAPTYSGNAIPTHPEDRYDLDDLDPMEKEIEYDNKEAAKLQAATAKSTQEEDEAKEVDKAVDELKKSGPVAADIIKAFHTALKEMQTRSHTLTVKVEDYGNTITQRISGQAKWKDDKRKDNGTESEIQMYLAKNAEQTMELFLNAWNETVSHLIPAVAEVTKKLKAVDQLKGADKAMLTSLEAIIPKKEGFEAELKKAEKAVLHFDCSEPEEKHSECKEVPEKSRGQHFEMFEEHWKKAQEKAKDFTGTLDQAFGSVVNKMPSVVFVAAPSLDESQKKQTHSSFSSLATTQKKISSELLAAIAKSDSYMQQGLQYLKARQAEEKHKHELREMGGEKSEAHTSALSLGAMTAMAVAAALL